MVADMGEIKVQDLEYHLYGQSIKVEIKHTPLPWDRRLKPWPAMKRLGIVALSWEEYWRKSFKYTMDAVNAARILAAAKLFNIGFKRIGKVIF